MKIRFHKTFEKQHKKLQKREKAKVKERLALFFKDEFDPILNNHPLRSSYKGYRSINIAGDLRAIYKRVSQDTHIFVALNSHSKLYK